MKYQEDHLYSNFNYDPTHRCDSDCQKTKDCPNLEANTKGNYCLRHQMSNCKEGKHG
jgi:hypothetical protein